MTTKLLVYNGALRALGQPRLAALTDSIKARYCLDAAYDEAVEYCLEQGFWNFAMRTVQLDTTPSVETEFGYQYLFDRPNDWVRTAALSADEYGSVPLLNYEDRTDYWLADVTPIYLWYVSNDDNYGLDLGRWPQTFTRYVQHHLAYECCVDITGSETKKAGLAEDVKIARRDALAKDALNGPVMKFLPQGRLVSSRGSNRNREGRFRAG